MSDTRHLLICLGDQLDPDSQLLREADQAKDRIWMAEVAEEASHVWSHKARIAIFLAAMRHFRDDLESRDWRVHYRALDLHRAQSLGAALDADLRSLRPARVRLVLPGDYRVLRALQTVCEARGVALDILDDTHFYDTPEAFGRWAAGRRQLRLEYYYRALRKRHGILMEDGRPAGGQWNFDKDNRQDFGSTGPGRLPAPARFPPDAVTREVLELVASRFATHPGRLDAFDWPVTAEAAQTALADFIDHRLGRFGPYQDAIWAGQPWLYHSRLSAAMNLKLLAPRAVVAAAERAYREGRAPIQSVEGFIRQVIGWREYVRGIYWQGMPGYLESNALAAEEELPGFYWTGETRMRCLADTIGQILEYGYAHHIQRLMVTGMYALLYGVRPEQVHAWYLAVFVDAVEWVEAPNTIGMSQFGDNGLMASKPYCATGKYIRRMSNYCAGCRFDADKRTGSDACPFTTLYWDFLLRNRERLARVPRMQMQLRNLDRLDTREVATIRRQADAHRASVRSAPASLSRSGGGSGGTAPSST